MAQCTEHQRHKMCCDLICFVKAWSELLVQAMCVHMLNSQAQIYNMYIGQGNSIVCRLWASLMAAFLWDHVSCLMPQLDIQLNATTVIALVQPSTIAKTLLPMLCNQQHYLEVIATQHNTHNVFANVMHVPLNSGHDDNACIVFACLAALLLLFLNEGQQVCNSLLHHSSRLDDLDRTQSVVKLNLFYKAV